ncbi:MAG TPA: hypothetical protein PLL69_02085 [Gemmatimonadales bacterium]|nr:hypothetical protein [Gemmatimonadales bacterium]
MRRNIIALVVVLMVACGDSGPNGPTPPPGPPPPPPPPPDPGPGPFFSVSPIEPGLLARITPIGYNNKVLPVAHTYWETCEMWGTTPLGLPCSRAKLPLKAPGSGKVHHVDPSTDGQITVEGPPGFSWHFGHVTPRAGLVVGDTIHAGDVIATMVYDHGFDFGAVHHGISHSWIVPEHWSEAALHAQHPVAQFPPGIRNQLLTRMHPISPPYGRVSYDVDGTASGAWVVQGSNPVYFTRDNEPLWIWFGRWADTPTTRLATFGDPLPGGAWRFAADPSAPDWESITPASGIVAIKLWSLGSNGKPNPEWGFGTLLLQLTAPRRLKAEWFDTHDPVSAFTAAAKEYER